MPRPANPQPTEGELEILRVLWETGPSPLGPIRDAIRTRRKVATTTVASMLKVMLDKGLVSRTRGAPGWIWAARVNQRNATRGLVGRLLDHVFDGSASRLVSHLVQEGRLSQAERAEIIRLLEEQDRP